MPETEVMTEVSRAFQVLARADRRLVALADELKRRVITFQQFGDEADRLFEDAVVSAWDIDLTDAVRSIGLAQARADGDVRRIGESWARVAEDIARRTDVTPTERATLLAAAAAPVGEEERRLLDSSEQALLATAHRLASARQVLRDLVLARREAARLAARAGAPERLGRIVETHLESVGPNGAGGASSLDSFLAGLQLRVPTVVLRDKLPDLRLSERIKPLLAMRITVGAPSEESGKYPEIQVLPKQVVLRVGRLDGGRKAEQYWRGIFSREYAEGWGENDRVLVVYGFGLFKTGRAPSVRSADAGITYTLLDVDSEEFEEPYIRELDVPWREARRQATSLLERKDSETLAVADAALIRATLGPGIHAGVKRFTLNNLAVEWLEGRGNVSAALEVVRPLGEDNSDPVQTVFLHDRFQVRARVNAACGLEALECVVFKNQQPWPVAGEPSLLLRRSPTDALLYESPVIRVVSRNGELPPTEGVVDEVIENGASILALLPRDGAVLMEQAAGVGIEQSPAAVEAYWDHWLQEAERLSKKKAPPGQPREGTSLGRFAYRHIAHGNQEIPIYMGDYAAMLMLRRAYVRLLAPMRDEIRALQQRAQTDPSALQQFYDLARPAMADSTNPLANIPVPHPVESLYQQMVPFSSVYDEAFLNRAYPPGEARRAWMIKATTAALTTYVDAMDAALVAAEGIKDDEMIKLLELTGTGFESIAAWLRPHMLRRTANGAGWEPNPFAIGRLGGVKAIANEHFANRALTKIETDIVLVSSTLVFFAPSTVFFRGVSLFVSGAFLGKTLFEDVPNWWAGRKDLEFALGSYAVLGPRRMAIAEARRTPGIAVAIGLIGSTLAVASEWIRFTAAVHDAAAMANLQAIVSSVERGKLPVFAALATEQKLAYAAGLAEARLAQVDPLRRVTDLHRRVLAVDRALEPHLRRLERIRTLAIDEMTAARMTERILQRELGLARPKLPVPAPVETPLSSTMPSNSTLLLPRLPEVPHGFPAATGGTIRLPSGQQIAVGRRLGVGEHAVVYEYRGDPKAVCNWFPGDMAADTPLVIKVMKEGGAKGAALVERQRRTALLLNQHGIKNLQLWGGETGGNFPYVVQARLPAASRTYSYQGAVRQSADWGSTAMEADCFAHIVGGRMPREHQRALLKLFRDLADKNLIWEDGHLGNVCFIKNGDVWEAAVIDHERIVSWSHNLLDEAAGMQLVADLEAAPTAPMGGFLRNRRIYSLENAALPADAEAILGQGKHLYPDSRFFMAKMLECDGRYIRFNPVTGQWLGKHLDLDLVAEAFPGFENLRSLPPLPR